MIRVRSEPLVSVVIPTYNRRGLLRHAIRSVRAQSHAHWELIVADDGSDDGTAEYVASLGDSRIRVIVLERSGHIGKVRNAGARAARGAYIAFLDSDDLWLPEKLREQLLRIEETGARWCYTGYSLVNEEGEPVPFRAGSGDTRSGWIAREILQDEVGVAVQTLLVERRLFEEVGGCPEDPRLRLRGDLELSLRLACRAEAAAVDDVLAMVREHSGRTTNREREPHERTARVFEVFLEWCEDPALRRIARRRRARHLAASGKQRLRAGRVGGAVSSLARALWNAAESLREENRVTRS